LIQGAAREGRRTVLVVDDDARNRALVRGRLAPSFEVLEAGSGAEALDLLSRLHVDLVLLDVMMPALNGFDTCRAIKAMPDKGFLPVVLLTALSGQEDRNEGLAAGADEFLAKPIDHRELTLRVRALLTLREQDARIRLQVDELREKEAVIRKQLDELQHLQVLKDDLFSLIVHDLRNPLAGVAGYLELLQLELTGPSHEVARQNADRAAEASRKLRDLLDEVLEVQRLEETGLPLDRQPVHVAPIARDALGTLEGAARRRHIKLELAPGDDPILWLDRSLTRRAFENLVANAVKFSPANDTVSVEVRTEGERVIFEVTDRGPGVSDSLKVKLFKKFASVEARAVGERRRGFGLGLHLVKLVANAHGGEAFVRDHVGGGSVFGVSFPGVAP
jgi:signal transduction histidine kinase